jgi:hypothetical protein
VFGARGADNRHAPSRRFFPSIVGDYPMPRLVASSQNVNSTAVDDVQQQTIKRRRVFDWVHQFRTSLTRRIWFVFLWAFVVRARGNPADRVFLIISGVAVSTVILTLVVELWAAARLKRILDR